METVILWSTHFDNLIFLLVCILACYAEAPHFGGVRTANRQVCPSSGNLEQKAV